MKKFITAIVFNMVAGAVLGSSVGLDPVVSGLALNGIVAAVGPFMPSGVLPEGVAREIWTGELVKALKEHEKGTFLDGIPDKSKYVENDAIHAVDVGVNPDVLVNNNSYPIEIQELEDGDVIFKLDKFQTKATSITDDELYAVSYDKIASVKDMHVESIEDAKYLKAVHALAPQGESTGNFILETTGEEIDGRKRMTRNDIITLKSKFDKAGFPKKGRRLILSSDHVNDLLSQDQKFAEQYYNYADGRISRMYGFDIFEGTSNPYYTAAKKKVAFGTAPTATDKEASVAFIASNVFKATGSTKMYYSKAETDPQNQRNLINYRHYFVAMPKQTKAAGAIISATAGANE